MDLIFLFSLKQFSKFFAALLSLTTFLCQEVYGSPYKTLYQMKVGYRDKSHALAKHIVSLRHGDNGGVFGSNHYCSGTIITESVILTTALCVLKKSGSIYNKNKLEVVAGVTQRLQKSEFTRVHRVKNIILYPDYDGRLVKGNIAFLFLTEPLKEDGIRIQRIPIAAKEIRRGQMCTTCGWGSVMPKGPQTDELLYANVTILSPQSCLVNFRLTKGLICGGNKDGIGMVTGDGDAGSPLICDEKLAGIVAYSTPQFLLSFYVDIWYYRDWIKNNEGIPACKCSLLIMSISLIVGCLYS